MNDPQPPAVLTRVLRRLLILAVLAGMVLLPGAHCPDTMATAGAGASVAAHLPTPTADRASQHTAGAGAAVVLKHDECDVVRAAAVSTAVGARLPLPSGTRITAVASAPAPARTRTVPAMGLATIGVCRT